MIFGDWWKAVQPTNIIVWGRWDSSLLPSLGRVHSSRVGRESTEPTSVHWFCQQDFSKKIPPGISYGCKSLFEVLKWVSRSFSRNALTCSETVETHGEDGLTWQTASNFGAKEAEVESLLSERNDVPFHPSSLKWDKTGCNCPYLQYADDFACQIQLNVQSSLTLIHPSPWGP